MKICTAANTAINDIFPQNWLAVKKLQCISTAISLSIYYSYSFSDNPYCKIHNICQYMCWVIFNAVLTAMVSCCS